MERQGALCGNYVCYLGVEGLTLCVIDQFDSQWLMPIASDLGGQDNADVHCH